MHLDGPQDAPQDWRGTLKHLGPGLIITACIVGSGELIATPKVGAEYGFSLLWFIVAGCMIKVLVQVDDRYTGCGGRGGSLGRRVVVAANELNLAPPAAPLAAPVPRVRWRKCSRP